MSSGGGKRREKRQRPPHTSKESREEEEEEEEEEEKANTLHVNHIVLCERKSKKNRNKKDIEGKRKHKRCQTKQPHPLPLEPQEVAAGGLLPMLSVWYSPARMIWRRWMPRQRICLRNSRFIFDSRWRVRRFLNFYNFHLLVLSMRPHPPSHPLSLSLPLLSSSHPHSSTSIGLLTPISLLISLLLTLSLSLPHLLLLDGIQDYALLEELNQLASAQYENAAVRASTLVQKHAELQKKCAYGTVVVWF